MAITLHIFFKWSLYTELTIPICISNEIANCTSYDTLEKKGEKKNERDAAGIRQSEIFKHL